MRIPVSSLLVLLTFPPLLLTQCYNPDGSPAIPAYQPCNTAIDGVSMCCGTGPGWNDECLFNGLCKGSPNRTQLWRVGCTDRTWRSPLCLKLCTAGFGTHMLCMSPSFGSEVMLTEILQLTTHRLITHRIAWRLQNAMTRVSVVAI